MMTDMKHTPTPWKVVSDPHFDSGLVYTSIQPLNIDEEAMKPLAMMNGEYHVCRMSHTAAPWRFNYHRENAEFIVTAVNAYYPQQAELEALRRRVDELELSNQTVSDEMGNQIERLIREKADARRLAIEECVKVAEDFTMFSGDDVPQDQGANIAAAIRALRDAKGETVE